MSEKLTAWGPIKTAFHAKLRLLYLSLQKECVGVGVTETKDQMVIVDAGPSN